MAVGVPVAAIPAALIAAGVTGACRAAAELGCGRNRASVELGWRGDGAAAECSWRRAAACAHATGAAAKARPATAATGDEAGGRASPALRRARRQRRLQRIRAPARNSHSMRTSAPPARSPRAELKTFRLIIARLHLRDMVQPFGREDVPRLRKGCARGRACQAGNVWPVNGLRPFRDKWGAQIARGPPIAARVPTGDAQSGQLRGPVASEPYQIPTGRSLMKQFLLKFFTWWNGQTFGTQLWTWRFGELVGTDEQGNRYYRTKGGQIDPTLNFERRWVVYNGYAEASRIPPSWHGWIHHTVDLPPTEENYTPREWEKPHVPNMTGTPAAYRPTGSTLASGRRPKATGDYQPWTPGS